MSSKKLLITYKLLQKRGRENWYRVGKRCIFIVENILLFICCSTQSFDIAATSWNNNIRLANRKAKSREQDEDWNIHIKIVFKAVFFRLIPLWFVNNNNNSDHILLFVNIVGWGCCFGELFLAHDFFDYYDNKWK